MTEPPTQAIRPFPRRIADEPLDRKGARRNCGNARCDNGSWSRAADVEFAAQLLHARPPAGDADAQWNIGRFVVRRRGKALPIVCNTQGEETTADREPDLHAAGVGVPVYV